MEKIKKAVMDATKREIDMAQYYIDFYEYKGSKLTEDKDIAANCLKIQQMKDAKSSNELALAQLKEYNKTI